MKSIYLLLLLLTGPWLSNTTITREWSNFITRQAEAGLSVPAKLQRYLKGAWIMSFESGITFFIAIFIFAITPGPGVFAILARALVSGSTSCLSLCFGMTISDVVYLVLACFGLATIAENYGAVFTVIRFAGAGYLLYLAWKMWFSKVNVDLQEHHHVHRGYLTGCVQGFLISASNPKVILFYIAFLPSFMDLTILSHRDIVLVAGLTIIALMLGLMLVAVCAASARKMFGSERALKRLNRTAGGIMAGAGVYLVSNG